MWKPTNRLKSRLDPPDLKAAKLKEFRKAFNKITGIVNSTEYQEGVRRPLFIGSDGNFTHEESTQPPPSNHHRGTITTLTGIDTTLYVMHTVEARHLMTLSDLIRPATTPTIRQLSSIQGFSWDHNIQQQTSTGGLLFTLFDRDPFHEYDLTFTARSANGREEGVSLYAVDQNEYGQIAKMAIYNFTLNNYVSGISVDDVTSDLNYIFAAGEVTPWLPIGNIHGENPTERTG